MVGGGWGGVFLLNLLVFATILFFISESGNSSQRENKETGFDYTDDTHYYDDYGQYVDYNDEGIYSTMK